MVNLASQTIFREYYQITTGHMYLYLMKIVWNMTSQYIGFLVTYSSLIEKFLEKIFLDVKSMSASCKMGIIKTEKFEISIWAASWQNQQNDFAPSEDSDQPGHPPSLIRVFAVWSIGS